MSFGGLPPTGNVGPPGTGPKQAGGTKSKIDWSTSGIEQTVNQIRNVALSLLFVDIAQERAMRSAGTLGMAVLSMESAYIRAHFAALAWGQSNIDAVMSTQTFAIASQNVESLTKQYGELTAQWIDATRGGRFLNPQALQAQAKMEVFAELHPGLEQQQQMVEQIRLMNVQILQGRLHMAVSELMLRENVRIAQVAQSLLEVQLVQTAVTIGASIGGPIGAGAGLGIGIGLAFAASESFKAQNDAMLTVADSVTSMADNIDTMATSSGDLTNSFKDLNSQIKELTTNLRDFKRKDIIGTAPIPGGLTFEQRHGLPSVG